MFQDNPPTEETETLLGKYFLPEWVTEIYYGGSWAQVKPETYKEFQSHNGDTVLYQDPFSEEIVIITEPVSGWKIKPPEPKSNIVELKKK